MSWQLADFMPFSVLGRCVLYAMCIHIDTLIALCVHGNILLCVIFQSRSYSDMCTAKYACCGNSDISDLF